MNFFKKLFKKAKENSNNAEDTKESLVNLGTLNPTVQTLVNNPEVVKYLKTTYVTEVKTNKEHVRELSKISGIELSSSTPICIAARVLGIKRPQELIEKIHERNFATCKRSRVLEDANVSEEFISLVVRTYPTSRLSLPAFLESVNTSLNTDYNMNVLRAVINNKKLKKIKEENEHCNKIANEIAHNHSLGMSTANTKLLEVNPYDEVEECFDDDGTPIGNFSPWAHTNLPSYFNDPKVSDSFKRRTWHFRYYFIRDKIFSNTANYLSKDAMLDLYNSLHVDKNKLWQETRWQMIKKHWGTLSDFEGYTYDVQKHIFLEDLCKSPGVTAEQMIQAISFSLNMNYSYAHDIACEYGVITYDNPEQNRVISLHSRRKYYNSVSPEVASQKERSDNENHYTEQLFNCLKKGVEDIPISFMKESDDNKYKIVRRKAWLFKNFWILGIKEFYELPTFTSMITEFYNAQGFEYQLEYSHIGVSLNSWFGLKMGDIKTGKYGTGGVRDFTKEPWKTLFNRFLRALAKDCVLSGTELLDVIEWAAPELSKDDIIRFIYTDGEGIGNIKATLREDGLNVATNNETSSNLLTDDTPGNINWKENSELKQFIIDNMNYREDVYKVRSLVKQNFWLNVSKAQIYSILSNSKKVVLWKDDYDKTKVTAEICEQFLDYIEEHPEIIISKEKCRYAYPRVNEDRLSQIREELGFNIYSGVYNTVLRMLYVAKLIDWVDINGTKVLRRINEEEKVQEEQVQEEKEQPLVPEDRVRYVKSGGSSSETAYRIIPRNQESKELLFKLLPYIDTSRSTIRVREAAYNWVTNGGILTPDMDFIHWDDDPRNNNIDNIYGVPRQVIMAYHRLRIKNGTPKGNVELNKSMYQQVLLEREIKKENI